VTKDEFIIQLWERSGKDVVGAAELEQINQALIEHFGTPMSPAAIARTLADEGIRLGHPEILGADVTWRERTSLLTPEDLTFGMPDAANALIEKIERLQEDPSAREHLRQSVLQIKTELELLATNRNTVNRDLAGEVAQWLTIWIQNPEIFTEWLSLRRATPEFRERFGCG